MGYYALDRFSISPKRAAEQNQCVIVWNDGRLANRIENDFIFFPVTATTIELLARN
jgi:hypothetical protein